MITLVPFRVSDLGLSDLFDTFKATLRGQRGCCLFKSSGGFETRIDGL